jgi:hypothetical protein
MAAAAYEAQVGTGATVLMSANTLWNAGQELTCAIEVVLPIEPMGHELLQVLPVTPSTQPAGLGVNVVWQADVPQQHRRCWPSMLAAQVEIMLAE